MGRGEGKSEWGWEGVTGTDIWIFCIVDRGGRRAGLRTLTLSGQSGAWVGCEECSRGPPGSWSASPTAPPPSSLAGPSTLPGRPMMVTMAARAAATVAADAQAPGEPDEAASERSAPPAPPPTWGHGPPGTMPNQSPSRYFPVRFTLLPCPSGVCRVALCSPRPAGGRAPAFASVVDLLRTKRPTLILASP